MGATDGRRAAVHFGYYLLQLCTEEDGGPSRVAGILEDLCTGERHAFQGLEGLKAAVDGIAHGRQVGSHEPEG